MDISSLITDGRRREARHRMVVSYVQIPSVEDDTFAPSSPLTISSPVSSAGGEEYSTSAPSVSASPSDRETSGHSNDESVLTRKPFFCTRCLTGFSTKGNLNVHLRTVHFKTYTFKCKTCDHQFSTKASLIRHTKMVHFGERPYMCPSCPSTFATKACVKRHCERKHLSSQV